MCCASFVRQAFIASLSFPISPICIPFVPDLTDLFRSRSHRSGKIDSSRATLRIVIVISSADCSQNCLGALDGTYIRVKVPIEDKARYRTRKNEIATNVLGVCSQDMQFIYVLPGWEGSAADGRMLRDAVSRRNGLRVPHEMDSSTLDDRGPGKNKKKWTENEDEKLIEAMFHAVNTGNHRADNGFKPGFYHVVERELNVKLPGAGIKAKPHIESRIKTMKRDFNIVYDMLYGPNTSGFGWDNDRKCVVAESPVWEEYIKSHKGAAVFKNKSLPHFEELLIIFGKDRATGKNAETAADVVEELDKEGAENETNTGDGLDENDASLSFAPTHNTRTSSEEYSSQRRRRSRSNDSFLKAIKEVGLTMGREIKESTIKLTEAMAYDVTVAAKRVRINEELLKLPTISMFERHKTTLQIARDHEITDVFFTITDDEKEEWVKALLRGDI
ncbi:hypothetical protein F0562_027685 [Nyssa sinensis]|uniref:Myb/SANT-like domain-containing protein n=1 Tax=Nyssa sinensis TaxID=561372 RepID=A0A5J5B8J9_9ASTE|nr:hypothetical protein F0562_027685 [Nyssa sinensis]